MSGIFQPIATKFCTVRGFMEQHPLKNFGELWSIFGVHKFSIADISGIFLLIATKFCLVGGFVE